MAKVKVGDRVRIKDKEGWPNPPGYVLARAEGVVVKWVEYEEPVREFENFIVVELERAYGKGAVYVGNRMCFHVDDVEVI